jgi:effector-binding domain-containing protein
VVAPVPAAPAAAPPAQGGAPATAPPVAPPVAAPPVSPPVAQPAPADAGKNVDSAGRITEITARPVLRLKGKSSWDDGFETLKKSLSTLDAEMKKLGLVSEGQPMAHFVDSDDNGFTFEALVPLKEAPAAGVTYSAGIDATQSPAGKVVMFQHEGAYDDIDSAYEAFTAWLDDKNLVSTGKFLEEYLFWPEKSDDPGMKLRITVFLK